MVSIYEIDAPDAEERMDTRQRIAASHLIKMQKATSSRPRLTDRGNWTLQQAFSF
jgi:hypothetical protein